MHPDKHTAFILCEEAASQGLAQAQFLLAEIFQSTFYVRMQWPEKALPLYQQAAAQGVAHAKFRLSIFYQHGICVKKDKTKAIHLCQTAAEEGVVDAQYQLTTQLKDKKQQIFWLSLAAKQDHDLAKKKLKKKLSSWGFWSVDPKLIKINQLSQEHPELTTYTQMDGLLMGQEVIANLPFPEELNILVIIYLISELPAHHLNTILNILFPINEIVTCEIPQNEYRQSAH